MGTKYSEREVGNREHDDTNSAKKTNVTHIGGEAQGELDLSDYIPNLDEKISDLRKALMDTDNPADLRDVVNAMLWAMEAALDSGNATGGSDTTLVDTNKDWDVDMWKNAFVEIQTAVGKSQLRRVVSNTATTITFTAALTGDVTTAGDAYTLKIPVHVTDIERFGGVVQTGEDLGADIARLMIILQPISHPIHDDETVTITGSHSSIDIDRKKHVELDVFVDANAAPLPAGSTLQYHVQSVDGLSGEVMETFDSEVIDADTINALGEGLKEWTASIVIDATVHKIGKFVSVAWTRGGGAGDWPHVSANLVAK